MLCSYFDQGCPYVPMPDVRDICEHVLARKEYGRVIGCAN